MPMTHHDLKVGRWYQRYGTLVYIHDRIVKGQTGRVDGIIPFPTKLDKCCGPNCELLKKMPTCKFCAHKGLKVDFTGSSPAGMVSYIISECSINVDKFQNTFWNVNTHEVTSRSIANFVDPEDMNKLIWPVINSKTGTMVDSDTSGEAWKERNAIITALTHSTVTLLKQKPKDSDQIQKTAQANKQLAASLYRELLNKMTPPEFKGVTGTTDAVEMFRDRNMFMANIVGGSSQYDWYSSFTASQNATITQLVLKVGMRDHPDLVTKILDCFKKVEKARTYEEQPFKYDIAWVEKFLLGDQFTKPTVKQEVALPF